MYGLVFRVPYLARNHKRSIQIVYGRSTKAAAYVRRLAMERIKHLAFCHPASYVDQQARQVAFLCLFQIDQSHGHVRLDVRVGSADIERDVFQVTLRKLVVSSEQYSSSLQQVILAFLFLSINVIYSFAELAAAQTSLTHLLLCLLLHNLPCGPVTTHQEAAPRIWPAERH